MIPKTRSKCWAVNLQFPKWINYFPCQTSRPNRRTSIYHSPEGGRSISGRRPDEGDDDLINRYKTPGGATTTWTRDLIFRNFPGHRPWCDKLAPFGGCFSISPKFLVHFHGGPWTEFGVLVSGKTLKQGFSLNLRDLFLNINFTKV